MRDNNKKGFTLIELLVVITILSIIASAGIPFFNSYLANARDSVRITDIKNIVTHLDAWDGAGMPKNLNAIKGKFKGGVLPVDPINKYGYQYNVSMVDASNGTKSMAGTQYVVCTNRPLEKFSNKTGDTDIDKLGELDIGALKGSILNGAVGGIIEEARLNGYYCDGNISNLGLLSDSTTGPDVVIADVSGENKAKKAGDGPTSSCIGANIDYGLIDGTTEATKDEMKTFGSSILGSACQISFAKKIDGQAWNN